MSFLEKRILKIIDEKSVTNTSRFLLNLEAKWDFLFIQYKQIMVVNLQTME